MIIKYYKGLYPLADLRELTHTSRDGTTAYHLVDAASKIGFNAECYKCDLEDINENNIILPCIANVIIDKKYKHFIVIYEIDFKKEKIIIADPADRIKTVSFKYFKEIFNHYLIILYPNKVIPIIDNSKINYRYFLNLLKREKTPLRRIIILSFLIVIFAIISSFYMECLINVLTSIKSYRQLGFVFIVFLNIFLLKNIFEYMRSKILLKINYKIDNVLTLDTYQNILSLPYHYYRNRTTGDIISRINDLTNVKDLISRFCLIVIVDIPLTLLSLLFMFYINKVLFIIALLIVLLYLLIIKLFHHIFDNYILMIKKGKSEITSSMVEAISGFETIKGLKIKKYILNKFQKMYTDFLKTTYKYQQSYLKEGMFKNIVNDLGFVFITFIGCCFVLNKSLSLGSLLTFNALILYFLEPIKSILSMDTDIKEAKCSYKRIMELDMQRKEEEICDDNFIGNIKINNLSYSFDNQKNILNNINLEINSGDKMMILGPSGSGKSTLFKILLKYYQVKRGNVSIDGIDINDINNSSKIKYINQIETLFTDTLYNNLTLGCDISLDKIKEVIDICYLDKIIHKDQLGLNQIIEENGFNLSGGERQRIVLARTLLLDFDILIIDEGLNQIDINLERKILLNILNKYKNKTIIVISHRLNNKDLYNKIVRLNNGELVYS